MQNGRSARATNGIGQSDQWVVVLEGWVRQRSAHRVAAEDRYDGRVDQSSQESLELALREIGVKVRDDPLAERCQRNRRGRASHHCLAEISKQDEGIKN